MANTVCLIISTKVKPYKPNTLNMSKFILMNKFSLAQHNLILNSFFFFAEKSSSVEFKCSEQDFPRSNEFIFGFTLIQRELKIRIKKLHTH